MKTGLLYREQRRMQASPRKNQVKLARKPYRTYKNCMQKRASHIGVFGGTFDPVHLGHVRAALAAFEALELDRLIWVPNHQSPLRLEEKRTPGHHRLAMLERAVKDMDGFELSDVELRREGPSYLIDTLETLRAERPEAEWHFLMGMDSLHTFDRWVRVEEIVTATRVWVMPRPGGEAQKVLSALEARAPGLRGKIRLLAGPTIDISATDIRERIKSGESIEHLVPKAVANYIREQKLYQ